MTTGLEKISHLSSLRKIRKHLSIVGIMDEVHSVAQSFSGIYLSADGMIIWSM